MQLLTMQKTWELMKEENPMFPIGIMSFRSMVKEGLIPSVRVGNRYYLDADVTREAITGIVINNGMVVR